VSKRWAIVLRAAGLDIDAAAGSYTSTGAKTDRSSAADGAWSMLPEGGHGERSSVQMPIDSHMIEACENLLESYLMQVLAPASLPSSLSEKYPERSMPLWQSSQTGSQASRHAPPLPVAILFREAGRAVRGKPESAECPPQPCSCCVHARA
jgi:hypothetical protein